MGCSCMQKFRILYEKGKVEGNRFTVSLKAAQNELIACKLIYTIIK